MSDRIDRERRSKNMAAIRSTDMKPELIVRRVTHSLGYRYRLHQKDLPGKPDLVFKSRRRIIFVHGCFWHQHAAARCLDGRMPKSNLEYWVPKLQKNMQRDRSNRAKLKKLNWEVLIIWECETKNIDKMSRKIDRFLSSLH